MSKRLLCRLAAVCGALALAWVVGCPGRDREPAPEPDEPAGYFADRTADSGIRFTYRNGQEAGHFAILESLGGGVALIDYDGDGLLDVFVTGGGYFDGPDKRQIKGHPCKLYRNLGNFRFKDVTREAGLDRIRFYTHGAAVADYDNDGWPDLLVTGWGGVALFHNEPVDPNDPSKGRRFRDVTKQAGLTDTRWSTSAAWADFDGDGRPDVYICHYVNWSFANHPECKDYQGGERQDVCPPKMFEGLPHVLYLNNGDGTFHDASKRAGLRVPRTAREYAQLTYLDEDARDRLREADRAHDYGKGLGVVVTDVNDDGRPDIYVANDTTDNLLYVNQGKARFEEVGLVANAARDDNASPNGSMGVDAADYDGSGRMSLFCTNYQNEAHALYRNLGNGLFHYASKTAGIAAIQLNFVGFGTGFFDFDHDGAEDLFITNGHVVRHPPRPGELYQRPVLLRNLRRPGQKPYEVRFEDVSEQGGPFFRGKYVGRGVALGDLDNDGRVDLVISHLNGPVVVLQNRVTNANHWLGVELVGDPYRDAVGARLTLEVGGRKLVRVVKGGGSYLSSSDRRVVFGLGPAREVGRLTVRWPSGKVQTWDGLAADRYWQLREGVQEAQVPRGTRPPR